MKKLLSIATVTAILCMSVTACNKDTNIDTDSNSKRFITVSEQYESENNFTIVADKETSVCYLVFKGANKGGITPLIDRDGKPVLHNK